MDWRGIPFNFYGSDSIQQNFLNIGHLPEIIVNTSFAYDTFLSGLFAGLIPAVVAIWAMRSNAKNINAERIYQQELANSNITKQIVSASRQVWINDLRDTASQYLGDITSVINSLNGMVVEKRLGREDGKHYMDLANDQRNKKATIGLLATKITLLLNPDEKASQAIVLALDKMRQFVTNWKNSDDYLDFEVFGHLADEFRLSVYKVVKNEWKKVKSAAKEE